MARPPSLRLGFGLPIVMLLVLSAVSYRSIVASPRI
jgi:hypothetical protein